MVDAGGNPQCSCSGVLGLPLLGRLAFGTLVDVETRENENGRHDDRPAVTIWHGTSGVAEEYLCGGTGNYDRRPPVLSHDKDLQRAEQRTRREGVGGLQRLRRTLKATGFLMADLTAVWLPSGAAYQVRRITWGRAVGTTALSKAVACHRYSCKQHVITQSAATLCLFGVAALLTTEGAFVG